MDMARAALVEYGLKLLHDIVRGILTSHTLRVDNIDDALLTASQDIVSARDAEEAGRAQIRVYCIERTPVGRREIIRDVQLLVSRRDGALAAICGNRQQIHEARTCISGGRPPGVIQRGSIVA